MREIKFRGKDLDGVWRYGSLVNNIFFYADTKKGVPYIFDVQDVDYSCLADLEDGEGFYEIRPETIGEFTGLRDKNGTEIYEGDILKVGNEKTLIEVRFVRGVFAFLWNGDLDDEFPCNAPTQEWAEVIGNIHDNPKLLKKNH